VELGVANELINEVASGAGRMPVATAGDHFAVAVSDSAKEARALVVRLGADHSLTEPDLSFVEEVVLMLAVVRAQERQRELEQRLVQAQRLESVGKLAGGIAHDFNNLLAEILNYAAFVNEALEESQADIGRDMREITHAAERAAELTRKLLLFARGERYATGSCAPGEVISDLAKMLESTFGPGLVIDVELAHADCEVAISADDLEQAAIALVVNAHDATPDGGSLTIRDELNDAELRISFTDGGGGMTPQVLESALDPFFTTKPAGEGSGLGLSTVHGIVDRAGGKVLIESTLGSGTTVTLVLPRRSGAGLAPAGGADPSVAAERPTSVATVLVVDDQEPLRGVVRRILESGGYRVMDADSVATARDLLRRSATEIDLLLTDVLMPGENGVELASHVAEVYSGELPVVFMSGYSDGTLAGLGADMAFSIIRKPFTREGLLEEVDVALGRSAGQPR
jgi:signal transduction histidine kinase